MGKRKKTRMPDRLSTLPEAAIQRILSFVGTKQAVQMSALSHGWRYKWASTPCLSLSSDDFYKLTKFYKFLKRFLRGRDDKKDLFSVKLTFSGSLHKQKKKKTAIHIIKIIFEYASSHNLQQLNITCIPAQPIYVNQSLLISQSLTHLTLDGFTYPVPGAWNLPALETLNLYRFIVYRGQQPHYYDFSSSCPNLKNLTLKRCRLIRCKGFVISHPGLSSLTLEEGRDSPGKLVNVEAPQLKNLTISNWKDIHLRSTPNLSSLHYNDYFNGDITNGDDDDNVDVEFDLYYDDDDDDEDSCSYQPCDQCDRYICHCDTGPTPYYEGVNPLHISDKLPHLEEVDICIDRPIQKKEDIPKLISLLPKLQSVRFLSLNWELVKLLESSVSDQPSPSFSNLEVLKVYPLNVVTPVDDKGEEYYKTQVTLSTEVKDYLLNGSKLGATLTTIPHQETLAMNNLKLAQNLIAELGAVLKEWSKELNADTGFKAPEIIDNTSLEEMHSYCRALSDYMKNHAFVQYALKCRTSSLLLMIKTSMTRVPVSHQAKLQERYNTLLADTRLLSDDFNSTDHNIE